MNAPFFHPHAVDNLILVYPAIKDRIGLNNELMQKAMHHMSAGATLIIIAIHIRIVAERA